MNQHKGIDEELSQDLFLKVVAHKKRFISIFKARYLELLPSLIIYKNSESLKTIDFLQVEKALRSGYHVVIGLNKLDKLTVLGYVNKPTVSSMNYDIFRKPEIRKEDVIFTIPKNLQPDKIEEISRYNNFETGNIVVMSNKYVSYLNDLEILEHYTDELAEIVLSRFSLTMQAKINTFFISEANDETVNQLVTRLYNGSPFVKLNKHFDPRDNIHTLDNSHISSSFVELKREYQNKISELNNMLGINSLAVEKTSGVSDTEAKSNRSFTTSNANIYLSSRNRQLEKLNKRFNLNLEAIYNDEVASEFSEIAYSEGNVQNKGEVKDGQ